MNLENWKIWNDITFKHIGYRKNHDFIFENENIVCEYSGDIYKMRLNLMKPAELIGEYSFSVINIRLAKILKYDVLKLFRMNRDEKSYDEVVKLIENIRFDIYKYDRIIIIHNLIIRPDYRKKEISKEFVEFIYRDFYSEGTLILAHVTPIQYNSLLYDYLNDKRIIVENEEVDVLNYYQINNLLKNNDTESNFYKLFAMAYESGFKRLNDKTNIFILEPEFVLNRIIEKNKY